MEFKAFLSHRYQSSSANLYFYRVFTGIAGVHFDVDVGAKRFNVTRIERMIRGSDAFIGLYPFDEDPQKPTDQKKLQKSVRYFLVEYDVAIRSNKPILIFYDQRYSHVLSFPRTVRAETFDIQEISGQGGSPKRSRFARVFRDFRTEVQSAMQRTAAKPAIPSNPEVAVLVPEIGPAKSRYSKQHVDLIKETLARYGFTRFSQIAWPPIISQDLIKALESIDFIVVDVGDPTMGTGVVGYLHGRLVPMLRLVKGTASIQYLRKKRSYAGLFGGVSVGYPKDILAWNDARVLREGLERRLEIITQPVQRISTAEQAEAYFLSANLRKETVFVSYAGKDSEVADRLIALLKNRFQEVFDYRDGKSITPGEPWLKEIFDKLSDASLGIPLVSENYLQSGNCMHEAQEMVAKRDANEIAMIPVKITERKIDRPTWMRNRQYLHTYDYPDLETVVEKLVMFFDRAKKGLTSGWR